MIFKYLEFFRDETHVGKEQEAVNICIVVIEAWLNYRVKIPRLSSFVTTYR